MKQTQYNQIALRTYLFGLDLINAHIGMEVKLRAPDDIETAEAFALEIANYNMQKQRFLSNFRQPQPIQAKPIINQQVQRINKQQLHNSNIVHKINSRIDIFRPHKYHAN